MSSRPGVLATHIAPADGGVSPNRYIPSITAEVRVFWPPLATEAEILDALNRAVASAHKQIDERRAEYERRKVERNRLRDANRQVA
ncbi:hypothetical protein SEA_VRESIDENCE_35 [Arthrobacter phage VResidence]|uniref:Uncharacterized protein n=1 Tax=Arthrobacter phage VResidence TaxID=2927294 RepID=A0A9X9K3W3_9CAUD|nr:hypothetical protein SEA_VRESIDENCE_35 [Arthrobacter phage VResidence]